MSLHNLNVLIVDDVKVVRTSLKKILNEFSMEKVFEASNIQEAWDIIEEYQIDLIFSDWNMPDGDGIELLRKLREHSNEKKKYTKFIMVTGAEEKTLKAMDSGANNIIHKPFDGNIILEKLNLIFK
jgi:CheY-like chemotaxis protein